jgi:predicted membrane protein
MLSHLKINVKSCFLIFWAHLNFFYNKKNKNKNIFFYKNIFSIKWDVQHWVFGSGFLNSPHCLVKHPKLKKKKKKSLIKNHKCNDESKVVQKNIIFFGCARPGSASGCFKKAIQIPKAGHPICSI